MILILPSGQEFLISPFLHFFQGHKFSNWKMSFFPIYAFRKNPVRNLHLVTLSECGSLKFHDYVSIFWKWDSLEGTCLVWRWKNIREFINLWTWKLCAWRKNDWRSTLWVRDSVAGSCLNLMFFQQKCYLPFQYPP